MTVTPSRFLGLAVALAISFAGPAARADDSIGQVKTAKGDVKVVRQGASLPLAVGDHVFQSDTISTAKGASVGITFVDNSMMSLGPSSQLALDQFQFGYYDPCRGFQYIADQRDVGGQIGTDRAADAGGDAYQDASRASGRAWHRIPGAG